VQTWLSRHPVIVFTLGAPAPAVSLVERLLPEVTERCLRRGSHTAVPELEQAMLDYLDPRSSPAAPSGQVSADRLIFLLNFFDELKRRAPADSN